MPFGSPNWLVALHDPAWLVATAISMVVAAAVLSRSMLLRRAPPAQRKWLTLLIDGIPVDESEKLERTIQSLAENDDTLSAVVGTLVKHSLVPRDPRTACATVSFSSSMPAKDLVARLRNVCSLHFDSHFHGITPLHQDPNGVHVDVLAVPGLGSHALGSWKSRSSNHVWLRDFLPFHVPSIRVLLYGYDTTLRDSDSKQSITDLGLFLLESVAAFRAHDGTSRRPIIFIGHSLGGLVIKEALVCARTAPQAQHKDDLHKSTYALLFFGVPHLGLRNHQLSTIVEGQPNQALVHDLVVDKQGEPSNFLKRLSVDFSRRCRGRYRVVNFYERKQSSTIQICPDGSLCQTGTKDFLVLQASATSAGLVAAADEDRVPFNTDHSGLVKYDRASQEEYSIVRSRLTQLVAEAKTNPNQRFSKQNQFLDRPVSSKTEKDCLKSLAFPEMRSRSHFIDEALDGTCGWLLKHETFDAWTTHLGGLLWIKGKPGSGKSTLLKFAVRETPAVKQGIVVAVSFFFHGRGEKLQKTPLGHLQSVLHQLLIRFPGELPELVDNYKEKAENIGPSHKWEWNPCELWNLLQSSILGILKKRSLILFVDGLDEAGDETAVHLVRSFSNLCQLSRFSTGRFGICFACRHYPILPWTTGFTICLDDQNKADITTFVRGRLGQPQNHRLAAVSRTIIARAEGVFLWARLVVERVLESEREGETSKQMKQKILDIPTDLDIMYSELTERIKQKPEAAKLLRLIHIAERRLSVIEVQWAMIVEHAPGCQSLQQCKASYCFAEDGQVEKRIRALGCGFVEIVGSETGAAIVQFIHQSVKDFFLHKGFSALEGTSSNSGTSTVLQNTHCRFSRLCLRYLAMEEIQNDALKDARRTDKWCSRFPLLHYAIEMWVIHAKRGQGAETSDQDLLHVFSWPSERVSQLWVDLCLAKGYWAVRGGFLSKSSRLLHIVAIFGLSRHLEAIIRSSDRIDVAMNVKDGYGRTALVCATERGCDTVVRQLIETGKVDFEAADQEGDTALSLAASKGYEAIVKLLLDTDKANIESRNIQGRTPLSMATNDRSKAAAQLLLNHGADINSRDRFGQTPLSWSAINGGEVIVRLLLATGKAYIDSRDGHGITPLMCAAMMANWAEVRLLLQHGADADLRDEWGYTPLSWAADRGHEAVVRLLVENKIKDDDGLTPLPITSPTPANASSDA